MWVICDLLHSFIKCCNIDRGQRKERRGVASRHGKLLSIDAAEEACISRR